MKTDSNIPQTDNYPKTDNPSDYNTTGDNAQNSTLKSSILKNIDFYVRARK